jgi:hypothetical protein
MRPRGAAEHSLKPRQFFVSAAPQITNDGLGGGISPVKWISIALKERHLIQVSPGVCADGLGFVLRSGVPLRALRTQTAQRSAGHVAI